MRFARSNNLTAFAEQAIGSKVIDQEAFMRHLEAAVKAHNPAEDRQPGQHFVRMPPEAFSTVSAGVGLREAAPPNAAGYVLRFYRGKVSAFLRREYAHHVEGLAVIVYTREAYLVDPDVVREGRGEAIGDADYVIVAVLASAGPNPPLSPIRFVHNLAGGNNEARVWTADEIRKMAVVVKDYADTWEVVAD